jgi:hypothetical protein
MPPLRKCTHAGARESCCPRAPTGAAPRGCVAAGTWRSVPRASSRAVAPPPPPRMQNWTAATPDSIGGAQWHHFSAICWFFGRDVYLATGRPVGLISNNWGGTCLQLWAPPAVSSECGMNATATLYNAMSACRPLGSGRLRRAVTAACAAQSPRPLLLPAACCLLPAAYCLRTCCSWLCVRGRASSCAVHGWPHGCHRLLVVPGP